ncbi:MAG: aminotransferase class I/II-fold pyridoxal phosphate-dependent enzyme [Planctomycetes bacterium]|nr:aminotransferase class I/II-fold pyridoxal phosphate-dependent enzyme [Planctomycetota bacterium]
MNGASDFRSDTVTRPTAAMRAAIAAAEVGDDVLDGDPTVRKLEARAAEFLGKDGALFVPSGTMANQVALGGWTRSGDEILVEREAHVVRWEAGAAGFLHGVQSATLASIRGAMDPDEVRATIRPDFIHCPRTALICVEQTHMGSGGSVVPLANLDAIAKVARERSIPVHMDGARLANAAVASGVAASRYAACADSVSLCFSKGLGAPVGSVVAGSTDFLARAKVVRKRLGGWMRQSGLIAAGALHALEHNVERLADDHALAKELARALHGLPGLACPPEAVETNLVLVQVTHAEFDGAALAAKFKEHGVLVSALSPRVLRFATHLDVGPKDVERTACAARSILAV